jgi:hypothetical protein
VAISACEGSDLNICIAFAQLYTAQNSNILLFLSERPSNRFSTVWSLERALRERNPIVRAQRVLAQHGLGAHLSWRGCTWQD